MITPKTKMAMFSLLEPSKCTVAVLCASHECKKC